MALSKVHNCGESDLGFVYFESLYCLFLPKCLNCIFAIAAYMSSCTVMGGHVAYKIAEGETQITTFVTQSVF